MNYCDPSGHDWEWGSLWRGLGYLATGIGAVVAGALVFASGVATLPMLIVAGVTIGAGALTAINGVSELVAAGTGYNFVEDGLFGGNSAAYNTYATVMGSIATVGSMACGIWYGYNIPKMQVNKLLDTYSVKFKHLPDAAGKWSKFASSDQAYLRSLAKCALRNTPMRRWTVNDATSYKIIYDFGCAIGTRGETAVRLVFALDAIITFFPQ